MIPLDTKAEVARLQRVVISCTEAIVYYSKHRNSAREPLYKFQYDGRNLERWHTFCLNQIRRYKKELRKSAFNLGKLLLFRGNPISFGHLVGV